MRILAANTEHMNLLSCPNRQHLSGSVKYRCTRQSKLTAQMEHAQGEKVGGLVVHVLQCMQLGGVHNRRGRVVASIR